MASHLEVVLKVLVINPSALTQLSLLFLYSGNFITQNGDANGAVHMLLYLNSYALLSKCQRY